MASCPPRSHQRSHAVLYSARRVSEGPVFQTSRSCASHRGRQNRADTPQNDHLATQPRGITESPSTFDVGRHRACPDDCGRSTQTQRRGMPHSTHIGPREVLRVALMRGDLDDVRNDMARALATNTASPAVLESLLAGLEGIGIDLSEARRALGSYEPAAQRVGPLGTGLHGPAETGTGGELAEGRTSEQKLAGSARGPWFSTKENVLHAVPASASTAHTKPVGRRRKRANRKLSARR